MTFLSFFFSVCSASLGVPIWCIHPALPILKVKSPTKQMVGIPEVRWSFFARQSTQQKNPPVDGFLLGNNSDWPPGWLEISHWKPSFNWGYIGITSLKLTASLPLKMDGWKMIRLPFWDGPISGLDSGWAALCAWVGKVIRREHQFWFAPLQTK